MERMIWDGMVWHRMVWCSVCMATLAVPAMGRSNVTCMHEMMQLWPGGARARDRSVDG